ncbi:ABC-type nitrate/sulfonate/bicarbonate transport system, permease component [Gracilibacillus ureilyticus]|uniref:ABC-type nitrate/sulfonate/bicarbonate transport system, permease component n=1 Tax=Gracilibacillus ureilyticus TaxID=531814 RepID=A0A1H9P615_9BACI|nr:ABC transporter permease [Gracilibacillus ureilyticus]SER43622.1 ABC-type nitrate/sulfonate/bicarbonate transport system, permease component [Gracilibacillus ureilyticus]
MITKFWLPISVILIIILIWELSATFFAIPDWILPAPTVIFAEAVSSWPNYQHHIFATIHLTIYGFVLGLMIGLIIAITLHLIPRLREALYPLLIMSQNIPIIVLAPLLVIWFGFGITPKLLIIILVCFFPIAVATIDGLKQTNPELIHYMKMAGATKKQIFIKLELPHALPSIFSGLKISATYSVMGAVISEWLGANQGIGVYMTLASSSFRTDRVFVAILFIMILCLLFFGIIIGLEKMLIKWRKDGNE